ncbi:unnamed protein product [Oikopleura dioica]|uniref:RING-type domain-containing protein n=1 Tax=Oikopleura dioica TaxID=34765 RepID=E4YJF3_OIKDI|nr:unnamed protein product [Oikopleura dioica]CBY37622.1 unnamed protein product [Oikopleura dioica]
MSDNFKTKEELSAFAKECKMNDFCHLLAKKIWRLRMKVKNLKKENKTLKLAVRRILDTDDKENPSELPNCRICMKNHIEKIFNCGHTFCMQCACKMTDEGACPQCKTKITGFTTIFY